MMHCAPATGRAPVLRVRDGVVERVGVRLGMLGTALSEISGAGGRRSGADRRRRRPARAAARTTHPQRQRGLSACAGRFAVDRMEDRPALPAGQPHADAADHLRHRRRFGGDRLHYRPDHRLAGQRHPTNPRHPGPHPHPAPDEVNRTLPAAADGWSLVLESPRAQRLRSIINWQDVRDVLDGTCTFSRCRR